MNIDTLIREVNPAPRQALPGPDSFEAQVIFERSMSEPPPRKRRPVLVGGLTLGTLGAAAGVALLISTLVPGSPTRPSSAAAATLAHLAKVAASQPATNPPGAGQFQYTVSEEAYENCTGSPTPSTLSTPLPTPSTLAGKPGTPTTSAPAPSPSYCALVPEHRQIWLGADDSGRILETFGQPVFLSAADEAAWAAAGKPAVGNRTSDTTFGPHSLSDGPPNFASLPTDPAVLGAEISARKVEGGPPGPAEDFTQIGDLLRETDASPALRAALYEVAAAIPGVELLGNTSDHGGQVGIGVAYTKDGVRNELIFDPTTSALLGEESIALVDDPSGYQVSAGTVLDWAVYLSSGIVNSLSDTPTGTTSPAPPVSCTVVPGRPGESHCTQPPA